MSEEDKNLENLDNSENLDIGQPEGQTTENDDQITLDESSHFSDNPSLDAPDLEAAHRDDNDPPKSQAVRDLEVHRENSDETLGSGLSKTVGKLEKKSKGSNETRGYQWFFVHLFGVLGLAAWAVGAFLSGLTYRYEAALIAGVVILLTIPTIRLLHVRTRAGLAGLGAALALVLCSFYDPDPQFLPGFPMALVWAFILTVAWLWLILALIRNPILKRRRISLLLAFLLLYPMIGVVAAVLKAFVFDKHGMSGFTMDFLNFQPASITGFRDWFFWPQTLLAFLVPPLAALFLLRDQLTTNKGSQRHWGGLWLALAGFVVLVFSFVTFTPAYNHFPAAANYVSGLWPSAAQYRAEVKANAEAAAQRALQLQAQA
ncbi:MAG: hypothetical protein LBE31_05140, partial [Deltaproteobacteria bacterium]|nr:hypothetical protein [Deltaproteobacteria bacterium]